MADSSDHPRTAHHRVNGIDDGSDAEDAIISTAVDSGQLRGKIESMSRAKSNAM